jgi:hypothetical protein
MSPLMDVIPRFRGLDGRVVESIEFELLQGLKGVCLKVNPNSLTYLSPLVHLEALHPKETLKVFTLNYDSVIEDAAREVGIACNDGFEDGTLSPNAVPVFSDIGQDIFSEAPIQIHRWKGAAPSTNARIEVFKLHGSVDWFEEAGKEVKSNDNLDVYHNVRKRVEGPVFSARSPIGDLAKVTQMRGQSLWWDQDGTLYVPRMIFGTTLKFMSAVPFLRMYELLYRYLRRCSLCVIVGYSFGDEHVNALVRDAYNRSLSRWSRPLRLLIVNMHARPSLAAELRLNDDSRVWQIIGRASDCLGHPEFAQLACDLHRGATSKFPKVCEIGHG